MGCGVVVYEHLARLGKRRGAIVEYLLDAGGVVELPELMAVFASPRGRPRDFVKRVLGPLVDAGIVEVGGGAVVLHRDWWDRLEQARLLADEHGAARRAEARVQRERDAYRNRDKKQPDPEPEMPTADDLRQPWPMHPEPCACRECKARFGRVVGEHAPDCRCASCFARSRGRSAPPPPPGWMEEPRGLDCECDDCIYPEPNYVRPCGGSGSAFHDVVTEEDWR